MQMLLKKLRKRKDDENDLIYYQNSERIIR